MISINNINIIKEINPEIWEKVKDYEYIENRLISEIEETRKGIKTLYLIKENNRTYLHSKYDPIREAETIIESYEGITDDTSIIFYGTGLGYHIKLILERYKNLKYYIYEPIPELLYNFLENINIQDFSKKRLSGISLGTGSNLQGLIRFIDINQDNLKILELPSHKQNFPNDYKNFNEMFLNVLKNKRSNLTINYSFQKRWILNSMKNFEEVLVTPNIIMEKKDSFKGKTAILVSAGPSLNEEIENLRYIKENGLAYIFSVGSSINTLIYHEIYPDAVCTYDPIDGVEINENVFEKVKEKNITKIPMIFGSSVAYGTQNDYPGNKYHMITNQDTVSNYYLKYKSIGTIYTVQDAPSIAVVTLQLLYELKFGQIILVGQNLGYRNKERYSQGISYSSELTEEEIKKAIKVRDVYGNEILTSEGFNSMRYQMECYINQQKDVKIINTTKGGANIEGTTFIELKDIIENNLKEKIVLDNWLEGNKRNYDKEHLENQTKKMDKAYDRALKINKDYNNILNKIERSISNRNFSQAETLYIKLDKELRKIENNDYYKIYILPMNRVQYKILADSIDRLNEINDSYEKGINIVESFRNFMNICTQDIKMIEPIYNKMKEAISSYILEKGE